MVNDWIVVDEHMLKLKMADDVDEIIVLASSMIIFRSCAIFFNEVQNRKRHHSVWLRGYLQSCQLKYGAYNCLMPDLEVHAEEKLKNYIRTDVSTHRSYT